jgi:lipopolysaccharide biosynthesis glycosyltransferase
LGDYLIAAVPELADKDHLRSIGLSAHQKYFNAGILVINLFEWSRADISNKLIETAKNNMDFIEWHDQDIMNIVFSNNWLELDDKYNLRENFTCDPVIIHFAGSMKPWHFRSTHPYKELYWKYIRKTPYRFYVPPDLVRGLLGLAKRRIVSSVKWS